MKPSPLFLTSAAAKSSKRRLLSPSTAFALAPTIMLTLLGSPVAHAQTTYTWTGYNNTTAGSATFETWGNTANWDAATVFVSGANNELMFFDNTNPTTYATGTTQLEQEGSITITGVPSLTMGTLTLDGRGPNSTLGTAIIIGDNSATWTIGDGATGTVNLTATFGGGGQVIDGQIVADRYANHTVNPNITLAQTTDFTGGGGGIQGFNFTGNITDGGSGYGITKSGNSRLVLSGNNTYTGTTTVSGGLLRLNSANALSGGIGVSGGTSALTITSGVVELASGDFTRNLGTSSDQFQITGGTSGFSARGGDRVITVNNDAATEVVWGSASFNPSTLWLNANTADSALTLTNKIDLNASSRNVRVDTNVAVLSGDIRNTGGTAGLTKTGNGTLILSGTNTYNGNTTISAGVLSGGAANSLGNPSSGIVFNGGTLRINGTSLTSLTGLGHAVTFNAGKTMGFDIADSANTFTVDQAISGGTLIKSGGGTLVLNEASFTGQTKISGGGTLVLDYGSGQDSAKLATNQTLTLSGGELILRGGTTNEVVKNTNLEIGNTSISRDGGSTGTIDLKAIGIGRGETLAIAEGGFAKTSSSTADGIFNRGAITVGSDYATKDVNGFLVAYTSYTTASLAGGGNTATNNQLTGGGTLTGTIDSNALRISNATTNDVLEMGSNQLRVRNNDSTVLYAGAVGETYTINGSGRVRASSGNQSLIVNTYAGTLIVNAGLGANGNAALTKTGAGTLVVGSDNDYNLQTYHNQGVLRLASNLAAGTTNGGIFVQNGAALELSNNINVGAEALTISGTGISNGGALRNHSGTNTYGGPVTIGAGGARINSDSTTALTLTGGIATAADQNVTFGGAGDTTVSTTAISGVGGLTKDGGGSLTLSAINTYTGATTVTGGMLAVNGSLATTVTVGSTATLQGSGSILGSVTVESGATIAVGNSIESLATGALILGAGSTFAYEMDNDALPGVAGDLTAVTGDLTLDNLAILTLSELGSGSWSLGEKLTLISYTDTWNDGTFSYEGGTLSDDSTFNFSGQDWLFDYNDTVAGTNYTADLTGSNFVTMTVTAAAAVPEPSTFALLGLGGLALILRRRK